MQLRGCLELISTNVHSLCMSGLLLQLRLNKPCAQSWCGSRGVSAAGNTLRRSNAADATYLGKALGPMYREALGFSPRLLTHAFCWVAGLVRSPCKRSWQLSWPKQKREGVNSKPLNWTAGVSASSTTTHPLLTEQTLLIV